MSTRRSNRVTFKPEPFDPSVQGNAYKGATTKRASQKKSSTKGAESKGATTKGASQKKSSTKGAATKGASQKKIIYERRRNQRCFSKKIIHQYGCGKRP